MCYLEMKWADIEMAQCDLSEIHTLNIQIRLLGRLLAGADLRNVITGCHMLLF